MSSGNLERSLTVELNVKKKTSDVASLAQDTKKLTDGLDKTEKAAKKSMENIDRLEKSTAKLKEGFKDLASSAFLLGSAGAGIEKLVMNFIRLEGAIRGLKGAQAILQGIQGMSRGDMLLQASRYSGIAPKALVGGVSKYAGVAAAGAGALAAGAAIVSGTNAADSWLTSKGGTPKLGHGGYLRNAQGQLYDWSPEKIGNQIELSLIGGGRLNHKGDIVSNDALMDRANKKIVDQAERDQREVHVAEAARQTASSQSELQRQRFQGSSGFGYLGQTQAARRYGGATLGQSFAGEEETFKLIHGRDAGAEKFRAMQSMLRERGLGLGSGIGEAMKGEGEAQANIGDQSRRLKGAYGIKIGQIGGKENQGEALAKDRTIYDETSKLYDLERKGIDAVKQRQQARMSELSTIREQSHAMAEMYSQDAAAARQSMRSSKRSLGSMNPLEGRITLGLMRKAKEKGFGKLTPEQRNRVSQFMPEEADRFFEANADKMRSGGKSFDDIMKGTFEERRISDSETKAQEYRDRTVNLDQKIEVQANIDEAEVARMVAEKLGPLLKSMEVIAGNIAQRVKALEEAGAGAAALRSSVAGGK